MNLRPAEYMRHRTLMAITYHRRTLAYRAMVKSYQSGGAIGVRLQGLSSSEVKTEAGGGVHALLT